MNLEGHWRQANQDGNSKIFSTILSQLGPEVTIHVMPHYKILWTSSAPPSTPSPLLKFSIFLLPLKITQGPSLRHTTTSGPHHHPKTIIPSSKPASPFFYFLVVWLLPCMGNFLSERESVSRRLCKDDNFNNDWSYFLYNGWLNSLIRGTEKAKWILSVYKLFPSYFSFDVCFLALIDLSSCCRQTSTFKFFY